MYYLLAYVAVHLAELSQTGQKVNQVIYASALAETWVTAGYCSQYLYSTDTN